VPPGCEPIFLKKDDIVSILLPQNDIILSIIAFFSSSDISFIFRQGHIDAIFSPHAIILFLSFSEIPFINSDMIDANVFSILFLLSISKRSSVTSQLLSTSSFLRSVINRGTHEDISLIPLESTLLFKDGLQFFSRPVKPHFDIRNGYSQDIRNLLMAAFHDIK